MKRPFKPMVALLLVWTVSLTLATAVEAQSAKKMVKIQLNGESLTGQVVAHDKQTGWFQQRDGRLSVIRLSDVANFEVLGTFQSAGAVELREALSREFGREFQVTSTGHYLVVAERQAGQRYAPLFEDLYRQFVVTLAARGFRIVEPPFPMVAVVLPTEAQFVDYCQQEGVTPQPNLRGYYLPSSNRVALYDSGAVGAAGSVDSTIVHEAVHQVAFNVGVHSRIGENPQWVVEGLATAFEVKAVRTGDRNLPLADRVNMSRWRWYQSHHGEWTAGYLSRLVATDEPFRESSLDAYSQAWALTFYLLEARSADFTKYLRLLSQREVLAPYPADQRLKDFQAIFGSDLALLEARLSRFYDDLAASQP